MSHEEEPPKLPEEAWEEERPPVHAYRFGEQLDEKDETRSFSLCPTCGEKRAGTPDGHTKLGELHLNCKNGHEWIVDKNQIIQDTNQRLNLEG